MESSAHHKRPPRKRLRVAGLFAGIGGFELGLKRAGHETALFSEIDPAARAVLEKRFPRVPQVGDIREIERLPASIDLVTAGFPCQDLSQAGTTAGIRGKRSSLVREVFRILKGRPVPWVLFENVPFMLSLDRGQAMQVVTENLSRLGYRWAYRIVDARSFGLPQRRRRVFILGSLHEDPTKVLLADDAGPKVGETPSHGKATGFYWTEGNTGVGWAPDSVPTLKGGSGLGIPSPPAILLPDGSVRKPDIRDGERLQGFPAGWTEPAGTLGARWKAVGNAVCVPVARWIGERLRLPGACEHDAEGETVSCGQWPSAAHDSGDGPVAIDASEWPRRVICTPIQDFLRHEGQPLSFKATRGFVLRAERAIRSGKLNLRREFLASLRKHMKFMATAELA